MSALGCPVRGRGYKSVAICLEGEPRVKEQVISVERAGRVGVITLNRPKVLNALNDELMNALGAALLAFTPMTRSVPSLSPGRRVPSPRARTFLRWPIGPIATSMGPTSLPGTGKRSGRC